MNEERDKPKTYEGPKFELVNIYELEYKNAGGEMKRVRWWDNKSWEHWKCPACGRVSERTPSTIAFYPAPNCPECTHSMEEMSRGEVNLRKALRKVK